MAASWLPEEGCEVPVGTCMRRAAPRSRLVRLRKIIYRPGGHQAAQGQEARQQGVAGGAIARLLQRVAKGDREVD